MDQMVAILGAALGSWILLGGTLNPRALGMSLIAVSMTLINALSENRKLRKLRS